MTDRHGPVIGRLLELAQQDHPGMGLEPADLKALRRWLDVGYTEQDLADVWVYFQRARETQYARDRRWASRWRSLGNHNLPQRVTDARAWREGGDQPAGRMAWLFERAP